VSVLPDVLKPGLRVVFCGTAVSKKSAEVNAYYAGPGNKFWKVLADIGLTPTLLLPSQYKQLLDYGLGLTDLAKNKSGSDSSLAKDDFDRDVLRAKIIKFRPRYLCFNGKKAAKVFLQDECVDFGLHEETLAETHLFVAPSTSNQANGHWDMSKWQELTRLCREVD